MMTSQMHEQTIHSSSGATIDAPASANQHHQQHQHPSQASDLISESELSPSISDQEGLADRVSRMMEQGDYQMEGDLLESRYLQYGGEAGMSPAEGIGVGARPYCVRYETLTTLQPLPPISTVSEKFNGHVAESNMNGSFTDYVPLAGLGSTGLGLPPNAYAAYKYENSGLPGGMNSNNCFPPLGASAPSMDTVTHANYSHQNQHEGPSMYSYSNAGLFSLKNESKLLFTNGSATPYEVSSMLQMQQQQHQHHPSDAAIADMLNGLQHAVAPSPQQPPQRRPAVPSPRIDPSRQEVDEINTREVAQKIGSELKRYSIPQAVFAQQVLCRSQGTLSDLLRNPKPWSKLKSGRETFRRMWKWLQEPEFQRMATLRLAGRMTGTVHYST